MTWIHYQPEFLFIQFEINMMNNSDTTAVEEDLAEFFRVLGQPARIQILGLIGTREACVSHLEAYLGLRQSAISQHLMMLRDSGLVTANREGRNVFYRLTRPEVLELLSQAARLVGLPEDHLGCPQQPLYPCPCPYCTVTPETAGIDLTVA
jgi:DNA-binding transcriptional ArsR family regulator